VVVIIAPLFATYAGIFDFDAFRPASQRSFIGEQSVPLPSANFIDRKAARGNVQSFGAQVNPVNFRKE